MNENEIIKACERIAEMFGGALEIFSSKNGLFKVFKYPSADGIYSDGYKQIGTEGDLKNITSIIKHKNGNITRIKDGMTFLITPKGRLKI